MNFECRFGAIAAGNSHAPNVLQFSTDQVLNCNCFHGRRRVNGNFLLDRSGTGVLFYLSRTDKCGISSRVSALTLRLTVVMLQEFIFSLRCMYALSRDLTDILWGCPFFVEIMSRVEICMLACKCFNLANIRHWARGARWFGGCPSQGNEVIGLCLWFVGGKGY